MYVTLEFDSLTPSGLNLITVHEVYASIAMLDLELLVRFDVSGVKVI
jgi:hypothetical protein